MAVTYTFTYVNPVSVFGDDSASGIDKAGDIVGSYSGQTAGNPFQGYVRLANGTTQTIRDPNTGSGQTSYAYGINNNNQVVGSYYDGTNNDPQNTTNQDHGFIYNTLTKTFKEINYPGALGNGFDTGTVATAINDAGTVAGYYTDQTGTEYGFVDIAGTFKQLPDANGAEPVGITSNGLIAGEDYGNAANNYQREGFLYDPKETTGVKEINDPSAVHGTFVKGVNQAGQVVGYWQDGSSNELPHAFVFDANTDTFTELQFPNDDGTGQTYALSINSSGEVLGYYYHNDGGGKASYYGFTYDTQTKAYNTFSPSGDHEFEAEVLSDTGIVVGNDFANSTINLVQGTPSSPPGPALADYDLQPPTVVTSANSASFVAGDDRPSTPVQIDPNIAISDPTVGTLKSATVAVTANFASTDVLSFTKATDGSEGDITGSYDSTNGTLTLLSPTGAATLAQFQTALQSVTFTNTAVTPPNATRTVTFTAIDNYGGGTSAARDVSVTDVDQTPKLSVTGSTTEPVQGGAAIAAASSVSVSDSDNTSLASASVSLGTSYQAGDVLAFTKKNGTDYGNIAATYNGGTLTLTSSGASATLAQFQNALDAITYQDTGTDTTSGTHPTRTLAWTVNDGKKTSAAAQTTLTIDRPPTITSVTLDKTTYGLGDTVTATIALSGTYDGDGNYTVADGSTVDGATLTGVAYHSDDHTITGSFVVSGSTTEVIAGNPAVNVTVKDDAGNPSNTDTTPIAATTTIDTHAPTEVDVAGFSDASSGDSGKAPAAAGSVVGALSTMDASPNDSFTYTLGSTAADRMFTINNGVLDVGATALTDGTIYNITVTSRDLGGNTYGQAVQVTGATTPTVISIVPADVSPTNSSSDPFTVTFSQAVSGVQASSFHLSGTDQTGMIGTPTSQDGMTWTVPVTGVSGDGTLGLDLTSTTGIASTSTGTALGSTHASDRDYSIDNTLTTPTIAFAASNSAVGAADVNAAHAATAGYTVGSVDSDATATVTFTGTLKSTGATGMVTGNGANGSHTVDLSGFRDGTVTASISDVDAANNMRTGTSAQATLDTVPPTITITAPITGDDTINAAEAAQGVAISGTTTAEDGQTVTVQILNAGGTTVDSYTNAATGGAYSVEVMPAQAQALANGSYTVTADVSDKAGNPSTEATQAVTVDETPPTITALADSGSGIDTNGNGDLGAGKTVTLTVTTSEPVTVTPGQGGATPTLTLNDGGTATYTGGSGTTQQTFSYTVAAGQNTAKLAVMGVNANGATATDAAGNPLNPSIMGATPPSGTLQIDTTAPTYGQGTASPAAGSDLGAGKVVTFTVPTSEPVTVTEANGGAPMLRLNANGEAATYTGTVGQPVSALTFSYTVQPGDNVADLVAGAIGALPAGTTIRDGAGNDADPSTFKMVDTGVQVDTTPPVASSVADTVAQGSGPTPIGLAAPSDNLTPAGSLAIAAGTLPTDGTVTLADGTTAVQNGMSLTAAQLTGLEFTPTGTAGQGSAFTYSVTDGAGNASQGTATLNVGAPDMPTTTPGLQPAPAPAPAAPDMVSLSQRVTYGQGVFTLTGTASPAVNVRSVEISAQVDGVVTDLGPATLNVNGTFTFSDAIGAHTQGFLVATETDDAGGSTTNADPLFSLTGGLGPNGGAGRQTTYTAAGAESAVALFQPNGLRSTTVEAPGQTVDLQPSGVVFNHRQGGTTFVYTPGPETGVIDVIRGFKFRGPGHDRASLPSADFANFADVLRNTGDVNGSATITDPKTGDAIVLAGVTTAELSKHPKDFTFHA